MKTLNRYIGREVLASTLLVLLGLIVLFAFFDLIRELGDVSAGYYFRPALFFVLLGLPTHTYEVFPIAALIGTLFALAQLVGNSEYTVMRSSGASLPQIGWSLTRVGLVLVVVTFALGEFVVPYSEKIAQQFKLQSRNQVVAQQFRSGVWLRQDRNFINVRQVELPDTTLIGVRIYEFDADLRLKSVSQAERGKYLGTNRWQLTGITKTTLENDVARVSTSPEMIWNSVLDPSFLSVLLVQPEQMSAANLYQYIDYLSENHQKTSRYEIAFWKKVFYPVAVLVMMFLALPFSQFQRRTGGIGMRIFSGIMVGLVFYTFNMFFTYLGVLYDWPPLPSAVFPTMIFFMLAATMLWWLERR
ncbi:MAG: LPS export ABC transporter permease LptG [Betaproteobacteria bacterium]